MADKTDEEHSDKQAGSQSENSSNERELLNMIVVQQRNLRRDIENAWPKAEAMAIELVDDLKKEYHLE